jgi:uncharacterized NAD-dependent epimerase/dehydratase family protein
MKKAVILAEGAYNTLSGKTAHGLVRFSQKFEICGVIDSTIAGKDAGEVLDGRKRGIKIYSNLETLLKEFPDIRYLLIGVATEGGYLPEAYKTILKKAITSEIHIVSGLHQFLTDNSEFSTLAHKHGVELIDVRKIFYNHNVFYTGKILEVLSIKVAVLGTDSIVGKRTTAIMLHQAFEKHGQKSTFVALGQTGWMQGFKYSIVMDSIINDFVAGAIEDVIWRAWNEESPEIIVTHGEGTFLHPAYPGGFELIAAGKPDYIILQHAPQRKHFVFFPQHEMPPVEKNLQLIELLSGKKPIATTIHINGSSKEDALKIAEEIEATYGILTRVPIYQGIDDIAGLILEDSARGTRQQVHSPEKFLTLEDRQEEHHAQPADELSEEQFENIAGGRTSAFMDTHDRPQNL